MKCKNCGAELTSDTKFCSYCGIEIKPDEQTDRNTRPSDGGWVESPPPDPDGSGTQSSDGGWIESPPPYQDGSDEIKENMREMKENDIPEYQYQNSGSAAAQNAKKSNPKTYDIVMLVILAVLVIMLCGAFASGKILAGIIAVFQVALVVFSVLLKKQILRTQYDWLRNGALALAGILIIPFSFAVASSAKDSGAKRYDWSDILLSDVLPEPESNKAEIKNNEDKYLCMYVYDTSYDDYQDYVSSCQDTGFSLEAAQTGQSFDAFNDGGYKLSLGYTEDDEKMLIDLKAPKEYGTLVWPDSKIANMLPAPQSKKGEVTADDDTGFQAFIGDTDTSAFKAYKDACVEKGFKVDAADGHNMYTAKNSEGYNLTLSYEGNNVMSVTVDEPLYNVSIEVKCEENLFFSKYDVDVYLGDESLGTIEHGTTRVFENILTGGIYVLKFVSREDSDVTGSVTLDIQSDGKLKYEISCNSISIYVETIAGPQVNEQTATEESTAVKETEAAKEEKATEKPESEKKTEPATKEEDDTEKIKMTKKPEDFVGMPLEDAKAELKKMGFVSIEEVVSITRDEALGGTVSGVEVMSDENDEDWSFKSGDTFGSGAVAIVSYYEYKADENVNLTVDNCPELAAMLSNPADIDESYEAFAKKYKGRKIEFDGRIDYCELHGTYTTRYDYLVSAGDYDPNTMVGPYFKFEDVNYFDLGTDLETVSVGMNVRIVAKVESYDIDSGLFFLDPVSVTGR